MHTWHRYMHTVTTSIYIAFLFDFILFINVYFYLFIYIYICLGIFYACFPFSSSASQAKPDSLTSFDSFCRDQTLSLVTLRHQHCLRQKEQKKGVDLILPAPTGPVVFVLTATSICQCKEWLPLTYAVQLPPHTGHICIVLMSRLQQHSTSTCNVHGFVFVYINLLWSFLIQNVQRISSSSGFLQTEFLIVV